MNATKLIQLSHELTEMAKELASPQATAQAAETQRAMLVQRLHAAAATLAEPDIKAAKDEVDRMGYDHLKATVDALPALVSFWDQNIVNVFANAAYSKFFGRAPEDIKGRHLTELIGEHGFEKIKSSILAVLKGQEQVMDNELVRGDGSPGWLRLRLLPSFKLGVVNGYIVFATDVTEEVAARKHLQVEHEMRRQLVQALDKSAIVLTASKTGIVTGANENFCTLSGYEQHELTGKRHREVMSGIHGNDFYHGLSPMMAAGQIWTGEICNTAKTGKLYFLQTVIAPMLDANGETDQYILIGFDVTSLKEADRRLEEAQSAARIGSWSIDRLSLKVEWSSQMYKVLGLDPKKGPPAYADLSSLIHLDDRERWQHTLEHCLTSGANYRMRYRVANHDNLWIESFGVVERDGSGQILRSHGTCQDITELVTIENQVKDERAKALLAAKLASLGELSAGVAHEINNPLAIIMGSTRLAMRDIDNPEKIRAKIEVIQNASTRIARIVNGLRKFSRSSDQADRQPVAVSNIIKDCLVLTTSKASHSDTLIQLSIDTDSQISCDEIEIEQVFINLINNAIDAAKDGPTRWIKISVFDQGSAVVVQIRDSGAGIAPAARERLFQPFFTTKPVGKGTGLGLSIVKGILDGHGASIEVVADDANTCFEVRFAALSQAKSA